MIRYLLKKLLLNSINKGILLVFIALLLSSGSYTFPGNISIKTQLNNNKQSFFTKDTRQNYFALFPNDLIISREETKNKNIISSSPSVIINDKGVFTYEKLADYLKINNPSIVKEHSYHIAKLYIEEAKKEGINHDVAFSQMCLETGFLKFGGDVDSVQNNFCGLGVTGEGVKGLSFDNPRSGIRAHIQHLKAYASTDDLNMELVDKRFHYVKRGIAPQVEDLTGKWATDIQYGNKITNIISKIEKFHNN